MSKTCDNFKDVANDEAVSETIIIEDTLQLPDGTVGDPALHFIDDTDTGFYRIGTNNVGVSAGGSKALDMTSTQTLFPAINDQTAPAISFTGDPNTGMYRLSADHMGVAAGGVRKMSFSGSVNSSNQKLKVDYLAGGPQLCIENASLSDESRMYCDSNDDLFIENSLVFKNIYMQTSNAGQFHVRPALPTTTNIDLCVEIGDGGTGYTPLFEVDESAIRSRTNHLFLNGSESTPSISFNNDPNSGVYSVGADQVGIATGGTLRMDVSTSNITSTLPVLAPNGTVSLPAYSFSGDPNSGMYNVGADQVGLATNGNVRLTVADATITSTEPVILPAGSLSNPSIGFTGATNFGLYHTGSDVVFVDNGVEIFRYSGSQILFSKPLRLPNYTVATLPAGLSRLQIYVSDTAGGPQPCYFNGSDWIETTTGSVVA